MSRSPCAVPRPVSIQASLDAVIGQQFSLSKAALDTLMERVYPFLLEPNAQLESMSSMPLWSTHLYHIKRLVDASLTMSSSSVTDVLTSAHIPFWTAKVIVALDDLKERGLLPEFAEPIFHGHAKCLQETLARMRTAARIPNVMPVTYGTYPDSD